MMIYYGMMTKKTGISKLNLKQLELNKILPKECWVTVELCDRIIQILGRQLKQSLSQA